jgi:anaerobic selenocysteine-containing dehydrogenase
MQMHRSGERGSASLKLVIVMLLLGACAYAGYLYIPVAFQANTYKDLMQHYADVAAAQGYPPAWAGEQLKKSAPEYEVPPNAIYTLSQRDNRVEIRVQYVRVVEFPGYSYNYEFDQTVKSTAFLTFK